MHNKSTNHSADFEVTQNNSINICGYDLRRIFKKKKEDEKLWRNCIISCAPLIVTAVFQLNFTKLKTSEIALCADMPNFTDIGQETLGR